MDISIRWLAAMAKLNVYRAKGGAAPHKPLLLLVVLELAEQGHLPLQYLPLSPDLAFRFCTYWRIVAHRRTQRPDVRMPLDHLQKDGFWIALGEGGKPSPDARLTRSAALDPDFVRFAQDPDQRTQARPILIARYFRPEERIALDTRVGLPLPDEEPMARDAHDASAEEAKKQGRDARFRLHVVAAYNYACALTGYRLTTISAGSIVDAAPIHPFSSSRNNGPPNGLALCKNAHWLFDNGLWSLTDDCQVLVAQGRFSEDSPDQKGLADCHGVRIRLPADHSWWPDPVFVPWHWKNRFQGG